MAKAKWTEVGSVLTKQGGGGHYVKMKEDITLSKGTILQLQDPRDSIDKLVTLGHLTAEAGEERKAKIPDYVKFNLVLPPAKE